MMSQLGPTLGYGLQDMLGGIFGGGGGGGTCGLAQTDEADSAAEVSQADADQDLTQVASQEISEASGMQLAQTDSHSKAHGKAHSKAHGKAHGKSNTNDGLHHYHKSYEKPKELAQ